MNSGSSAKDADFYSRVSAALRTLTKKYNNKYIVLNTNFGKTLVGILEEQF